MPQDDATLYTTWINGMNLGFGLGPWTLDPTGTFPPSSFTGFYINNNNNNIQSTNGNAWGMYANGTSDTNASVAFRPFGSSLASSTVFKIKWQSKGISTSNPNAAGGFSLRNGNATNSASDYTTGLRFAFYYLGAGSDSFIISDGTGNYPVGLSFGSNPFELEFTLLTADTYRLAIKNASGVTLTNLDNVALAGSGTIDSVALFDLQTDGDQIFNSMTIESASLTPPDILNLQPANNSIYVSTPGQLSFDVDSVFSTVSSEWDQPGSERADSEQPDLHRERDDQRSRRAEPGVAE